MLNSLEKYCKKNYKLCILLLFLLILIIMYLYFFNEKDDFDNIKMNNPIFRIFDLDLNSDQWDYHLDNVVKANGKYVLINPIQPVLQDTPESWNKYQPLDLNIDEQTKTDLVILCSKAMSKGIKIIVDVIWNHTHITEYNDETKHLYNEKNIKDGFSDVDPNELKELWMSNQLPKLNTTLMKNKNDALNAIETYRSCGVKGFRIDSANYIDDTFFDYVFKGSPKDEIHIYEIWIHDYQPYNIMMINRIQNDGCEVVFYNYKSFTEINNLVENILSNTGKREIQTFPPSEHLMNSILDQDLIMQFNKDRPLYLYMYFILSTFIQNDKYFIYSIFSTHGNTDNILIQDLLFNWENYFKTIQPILDIKTKLPKVIGQIECFINDYNTNNNVPILVGSVGKNCKILINLTNNQDNKISSHYLFNDQLSKLNIKNLITNKKMNEENIKDNYIIIPRNSYTIIKNDISIRRNKINIIMFWYQGEDGLSDLAKKSVAVWSKFKNGNLIFLHRENIHTYLSSDEMKVIYFLENKIEPPYIYAAISDFIRWIILKKIGGGMYIDCDIFPTSTTIYLINCYYEYDNIIMGKEPSTFVNNAVIIVNPSVVNIINIICEKMIYNIYYNEVTENNANDIPYFNDNPYFNWILMNTGPIFMKNIIDDGTLDKSKLLLLDPLWLYSTYVNKIKIKSDKCGHNLGVIQHCYASEWTN